MKKTLLQCNKFWGYAFFASAQSDARIGTLNLHEAITDAPASFLSSAFMHIKIMVGWMGEPQGSPVSSCAGSSNPVQLTTHEIGTSGGEIIFLALEEANMMATVPAFDLNFATVTPDLQIVDGRVLTTSLAIAAYFQKRHDNIIRAIQALECTPDFTALNFEASDYTDSTGRALPCYHITRDGFAFLAMGFTGKKAAQFKEAYITAFNQMEARLRAPVLAAPRTKLLMSLDGGKVSNVQEVPFNSFVADCNALAELFPDLSHHLSPADLKRISDTCISRLTYLAQRNA